MKKLLLIALIGISGTVFAQPVVLKQAIIYTTGTMVSKDEIVDSYTKRPSSNSTPSSWPLEFQQSAPVKRKSITYAQAGMVKTFPRNRQKYYSTITLRNDSAKTSTTLQETMGDKFYYTTSDKEKLFFTEMEDSLANETDTTGHADVVVQYIQTTKNIAGYLCKKAIVVTKDVWGNKQYNTVWYCPGIKLSGANFIEEKQLFTRFDNVSDGFEKVDGFIMAYTIETPTGSIIKVKVTKIDTTKKIAEKEFEIPNDFNPATKKQIRNINI